MIAVRRSESTDIRVFYDAQSEDESDSGAEEVSETDEDSGSDSGSGMKMSDDENTFSLCLLSRSSRSRTWHKGALRFKQLQFQSNSCGISSKLNDTDTFKIDKTRSTKAMCGLL